jgi:CRP-like cAMP-binding protein
METSEIAAALARCKAFASVDQALLDTLAESAGVQRFEPGDVVFDNGDESSEVYVVVSGSLRAQFSEHGPVISVFDDGALFGEYAMFTRGIRSARVTALASSVTITLDPAGFRDFLRAAPDVTLQLLETAVRRLARAERAGGGK